MKTKFFACATLAAFTLTFHAQAAQDGLLSNSSSVGQFTNTLGVNQPVDRMVQVLNVKDASVTRATPALAVPGGTTTQVGVRDDFCVVDTAKSTVKLTFTNYRGVGDWTARSSATGDLLAYRMFVATTATAALVALNGGDSVTVAAATTVASAAECSTGNVSKGVVAEIGVMNNHPDVTYVDTVIITATPV